MDQGGSRMDVEVGAAGTLRAEAHHPPIVAAGFCTEHSADARGVGYEEEKSPTLRAGVVPAAVALDHHPNDSRIGIAEGGTVQTLAGRMGTGGGNVPLVMSSEGPAAFGISSFESHAMLSPNPHAGIYEAETARALDTSGGTPACNQGGIAIVETFDVRFSSEGTRNSRGHCYPTDTSRCLDTGGEDPDSNHGGVAIVTFVQNQRDEVRDLGGVAGALAAEPGMKQQTFVLQGSMIGRKEENGPQGSGINEDVSFTLTEVDRHAVAFADTHDALCAEDGPGGVHSQMQRNPEANFVGETAYATTCGSFASTGEEVAATLQARDYKDPQAIAAPPAYVVRRLTPVECQRLQGFPNIVELEVGEMTRDEVALAALAAGFIEVNPETGDVFAHRKPGGIYSPEPILLSGTVAHGYRVYSIHVNKVKKRVRANRLVWMSVHGAIPEGMVVDHINNDKLDNRIANLQLLTPEDNSHKAKADGLYPTGDACASSKISEGERMLLSFLYWNTEHPFSYYAEMFGISKSRAQQIIHEYEWCGRLGTENPTEEEIAFWTEVFEEHRRVVTHAKKPKTRNQIVKWLKDPHTDSAEYKMWGNGIALPCAQFVLAGIAQAAGLEEEEPEEEETDEKKGEF